MIYYYAYCEVHGAVGPRRNTRSEAENDVTAYRRTSGSHGEVYVKEGRRIGVRGSYKYRYRKLK